jgi:RNA recognition motif-containing protein
MKIFVAGLPFAVSDSELQELFEPYGSVGSAKVISEKHTKVVVSDLLNFQVMKKQRKPLRPSMALAWKEERLL